jgi:flagellar biosynthesis chaperone FliJ
MQRFQFRLDRVLEWRRKQCQMEEKRLADCLALVRAAKRKVAQLQAERAAVERELLERSAIPAADFLNLGRYRVRADKEETEAAEERRQRLLSAAEQRARVQRTRQRVRLLEKMRDRRLEEHTAAAGRELENLAAEAYLARWIPPPRAK